MASAPSKPRRAPGLGRSLTRWATCAGGFGRLVRATNCASLQDLNRRTLQSAPTTSPPVAMGPEQARPELIFWQESVDFIGLGRRCRAQAPTFGRFLPRESRLTSEVIRAHFAKCSHSFADRKLSPSSDAPCGEVCGAANRVVPHGFLTLVRTLSQSKSVGGVARTGLPRTTNLRAGCAVAGTTQRCDSTCPSAKERFTAPL